MPPTFPQYLPMPPRAGIDPLDGAGPALAVLAIAIAEPPRDQTIALLLDRWRRGRGIMVVEKTSDPDRVLGVLDSIIRSKPYHPELAGVVLASVRATPPVRCPECVELGLDCHDCHELDDDVERWMELSERAERARLELLEWFVIGSSVSCPRDRLGEPPRW